MHPKLAIVVALCSGLALGIAGSGNFVSTIGGAQAQTHGGFHAIAVAIAPGGVGGTAWFVGQDGSAIYCSGANGNVHAKCWPVDF